MTTEAVRQILTDVEKFLSETLKKENKLNKKTVEQKQQLIEKLQNFFDENPDYKPLQNLDTSSVQDESLNSGGTDGKSDGSEETNYIDAGIGLIPAADLKSPVFSGFLEKKQKKGSGLFGRSNFQRRWCVVQAGIFYYFTSQKDKQQNGSFMLEGYKFRNFPDISSKKAEKDVCFELYHDNETKRFYQFMAKSKTEYEQWQSVIECGGFPTIEEDIYDFVEGSDEPPVAIQVENDGEEYEDPDAVKPPRPPPPPSPKSLDKPRLPPPPIESSPKPPIKPVSSASLVAESDELYEDAISPQVQTEDLPLPPPPPSLQSAPPTTEIAAPPPKLPPPMKRPNRDLPPPPPEKKRVKIKIEYKPLEDFENRFYGKWDCKGDNSNELTFKKGDIIHILSREFDEKSWWVGEVGGKFGLVPKNFLVPAFTAMA
ncbi:Src kinase-associated phosphoprotein 2 [Mactra antiquata]